jgi:hypothetical protein
VARVGPRGRRLETSVDTQDDDDEDRVEEIEARAEASQELRTSIDDLTTEADPERFDRTFTTADANLTIEGQFDPVAGPKQVIPRVAYTINYQMVYNEDRGRWEPQKKSSGVGGVGAGIFQDEGGQQTVPGDDSLTTVALSGVDFDTFSSVDVTGGSLTIGRDGVYTVEYSIQMSVFTSGGDVDSQVRRNGTTIAFDSLQPGSGDQPTLSNTRTLELNEGDVLTMNVNQDSGSDEQIFNDASNTRLTAIQTGVSPS